MSSSYRIELDTWLATLDIMTNTVLDIGGAQLPIRGRTRSWNVKKYIIADLPQPHANSPKPDMEMNLNYTLSEYVEADIIFCLEVFDYIHRPSVALSNIKMNLKGNGIAWVSFPSVYPMHQPTEDDSLRYMPGGIRKLASDADLEIVEMIPRHPETNLLDQFYRAERMRAAKHQDHNFTGWIVHFRKKE